MKKKLLSLVFLTIFALVPFKVNAETIIKNGKSCQVHKDYFLSFEYYSNWSFSESDPLEVNKTSEALTRHVDNYSNSEILSTQSLKVTKTGIGDGLFSLKEFNDIVFQILDKNDGGIITNNYVQVLENGSTKVRYFIHSRYSNEGDDMQASYPFFYKFDVGTLIDGNTVQHNWYSYANLTDNLKSKLKKDLYDYGYRTDVTFDMELIDPDYGKNVKYNIVKDYIARSTEFNNYGLNMTNYFIGGTSNNAEGLTGNDIYYRVIPGVFMVAYYNPSECTNTYNVTYYKNDGSNDSHNVTAGTGYKVLDPKTISGFTREGYTFVGWSTNKDATQMDSSYEVGKEINVSSDLKLYAVWLNNAGGKEEEDQSKNGLGYSIGLIGSILAATGGGVVYFKRRNRFENI